MKSIERLLCVIALGSVFVGASNEFILKNEYVREVSKISCMASILPFAIINEYRRYKQKY